MKKTRLLMMALCIGAITSFAACSGSETKEESATDAAMEEQPVSPPVTDTTSTITDTSAMKADTTKKP